LQHVSTIQKNVQKKKLQQIVEEDEDSGSGSDDGLDSLLTATDKAFDARISQY